MKGSQRDQRNEKALQMFVAGASYKQIAASIGLKSTLQVDNIIKKELSAAAQRRDLLTQEAFAVLQERMETLFLAHWVPATRDRDPRSAEICRRILSDQARMYGLEDRAAAVTATTTEPDDELAALRNRRQA